MVFSSVSSGDDATYVVPYTINVSQLPMVLTHERLRLRVLQPVSDIVYLTSTFGMRQEVLLRIRKRYCGICVNSEILLFPVWKRTRNQWFQLAVPFTVVQESHRFLGKVLDVSVDTADPVSSIQIHFEEMLQKEPVSIGTPRGISVTIYLCGILLLFTPLNIFHSAIA